MLLTQILIGLVPTSQPLDPNPLHLGSREQPAVQRAAFINDPWELVVAAPATMPPNTASLLRIPDLAGYDSLLHKDTQLYLADINGQDSAPPANGNIQFIKPTADPQKLREAGVRYVYSRKPLWPNRPAKGASGGLLRYDVGGARVGSDPAGSSVVALDEDGYDRQKLTVNTIVSGTVVVKDRLMPGWKAVVDGREVSWVLPTSRSWRTPEGREIQLWREVEVEGPGSHIVEFFYEPPGLRTGLLMLGPCAALTLGLPFFGLRRPGAAS